MISSHLESRGVLARSRLDLAEGPKTRSRITSNNPGIPFLVIGGWKQFGEVTVGVLLGECEST
jgi:hypothetical protein